MAIMACRTASLPVLVRGATLVQKFLKLCTVRGGAASTARAVSQMDGSWTGAGVLSGALRQGRETEEEREREGVCVCVCVCVRARECRRVQASECEYMTGGMLTDFVRRQSPVFYLQGDSEYAEEGHHGRREPDPASRDGVGADDQEPVEEVPLHIDIGTLARDGPPPLLSRSRDAPRRRPRRIT